MSEIPTLLELLKTGAHFGHKVSRWHPKMAPYIFGARGGVHILNLELTQQKLKEALDFIFALGKEKKTLLFVGTKKQAQEIIKKYASDCGMPYVSEKWLGGTFSNFPEIHKSIRRYIDLKDKQSRGELAKYTKKEQVKFAHEISKMERKFGGLASLSRLPDAVFILDVKREKTALREALRKKIPIIAICDTNTDPTGIKCPIPANDDAIKSIELIVHSFAEAYKAGKVEAESEIEVAAKVEAQKATLAVEEKPVEEKQEETHGDTLL